MPDKNHFNCVLQPFGISADQSNAMLSDNPHSGIYEADTSRTLDKNGGNPSCNQGGIAVVCVEDDSVYAMTTGYYAQVAREKSPTLLSRDYKDAAIVNEPVAYGIDRAAYNQGRNAQYKPQIDEEQSATIVAKGPNAVAQPVSFYPQMKAECQTPRENIANTLVNGTNPGYQNGLVEPSYAVRRLTPTECARLQGFPDWWCWNLGIETPTAKDITEWAKVFETYRKITGSSTKPKTRKQIIKWLKNPYSDAAEYKMWGNGVALPCVFFVLSGVVYITQKECE